jgi:hypothetical protein
MIVVACALASGCTSSTPTPPTTPLSVQVIAAPGQTVEVESALMRLRFQGVVGDSRCPGDALCIQGGDALVRIDVQSQSLGQTIYDLHTGNMQPVHHAELTITLVQLTPYPFVSHPISPGDYRATFQITR